MQNSRISVHIHVAIEEKRKLERGRCFQSEWIQRGIAALVRNFSTRREPITALKVNPPRELFKSAERKLVLHEDRIVLCGAEVWRDCAQPVVRDALAMLSEKDSHGFVRIRGTKLTKDLGRDPSNHIGAPLSRFCKRVMEVMESKGIICGREDVIQNYAGGYYFRDRIAVCIQGDWANTLRLRSQRPSNIPSDDRTLNERQRWILHQIQDGHRLTMRDVVHHFRHQFDRSTIGRDLRALRWRRKIVTHREGYYVALVPTKQPQAT